MRESEKSVSRPFARSFAGKETKFQIRCEDVPDGTVENLRPARDNETRTLKVSLRRFERCQSNGNPLDRTRRRRRRRKKRTRARAYDRAEKNRRIVRRGTHSVDALRAATPFVVVVAVPSKTSLDRRRVVVDEDAVETSDDAARRRNMDGRAREGRTRRCRDAGVAVRARVVFSRVGRLFARRSVASWRIPTPGSKP